MAFVQDMCPFCKSVNQERRREGIKEGGRRGGREGRKKNGPFSLLLLKTAQK